MSMFETESTPRKSERAPLPQSEVDFALTAQIIVAWAGEAGEAGAETRLGWWRSNLISEFGGEDLFRRLLPSTWQWAVLQAAREAARRKDAELRRQSHDPDRILSLFSLGFEIDERIDERLRDLKRSGASPKAVLPRLGMIDSGWDRTRFFEWVVEHGDVEITVTPAGRRLKGSLPSSLERQVYQLLAGLSPAADIYPLPHFQKAT